MRTPATDLHGKTMLITGGTGGIGKETARGLAKLGAHVILVGRDRVRAEAAVAELNATAGNERVDLLLADLSSQAAIRELAREVIDRYPRLDVLINNIGGLYARRWLTVDGIEATLAVNHLNPFLLTHLLLPVLAASAPARVINVTGGMPTGAIDLANLQAEQRFHGLQTYSHAKTTMMAVSYEFARRLEGTGVTLNVAYPGGADTAMTRGMTPAMAPGWMRLIWPVFGLMMRNAPPARAARSSIFLATSPDVEGINATYFNTSSKRTQWPAPVHDEALRRRLWQISVDLTGLDSAVALLPADATLAPAL